MHDIFTTARPHGGYALKDFKLERMVLAPTCWRTCRLPVRLRWRPVRFHEGNVERVPDDQGGVYSFVVKPGIADHSGVGYLLYVGKAERQPFRTRFKQYLAEKREGDDARRWHVTDMLRKWEGYLWFYYASISKRKKITTIENSLLASFLPPCNHEFPSTVKTVVKRLFAH